MVSKEVLENMRLLEYGRNNQEYRERVQKYSKEIKDDILCTFECRYGGTEVVCVKKHGTKDSFYVSEQFYHSIGDLINYGIESFFNSKSLENRQGFCTCCSYRSSFIRSNFRYDCTTRIGTTAYVVVTPIQITVYDNFDKYEVNHTLGFVKDLVSKIEDYMNGKGMNPEIKYIKVKIEVEE